MRTWIVIALASLPLPTRAQTRPARVGGVALTAERAVRFRRPSDLHFSPDGSRLVYVVTRSSGAGTESHLWMVDLPAGSSRDLTTAPASERAPRWSPDSQGLAFLS